MGTNTTNLNLYKPDVAEEGWGLTVNVNWDTLDASLLNDGTTPLTSNWDVGSFKITAETFESDVATGTSPFIVASTTKVTNLNADLLDGVSEAAFFLADGTRALSGAFQLSGDISPAQITSNQDDYDPTGLSTASTLRLDSDASRDITGLAGGLDGRILLIHNIGSNSIVLKDEGGSSTAANRFALNSDVTVLADNLVILQYDSTSSRWRVVAGGGGGGGGGDLLADGTVPLTANWDVGPFTLTAAGLVIDTTAGLITGSGVDEDQTLLTANIASTDPTLIWDENEDKFDFNKGIIVNGPSIINFGGTAVNVVGDNFVNVNLQSYRNSTGTHSLFNGQASRGTESVPLAIIDADEVFRVSADIYEGDTFLRCAEIKFNADGAVSDNVTPGSVSFATVTTAGAPTVRLRVRSDGTIIAGNSVFSTTPLGQFHIDQSSTSGAKPALVVDQADISEGTINFIASARGNGTTTAGDIQDTVRVELNGTVYRLALYTDA